MSRLHIKNILSKLEIIFYIIIGVVFIGLLFYFLGIQPMTGRGDQMSIWICICLVCGGMLMMAVYNLSLRFFTRREKAALYFSWFCICLCTRFIFMPGSIGTHLFPDIPEPIITIVLRYFSTGIGFSGVILFVYEIFGKERSNKFKYILIASIITVSVVFPSLGLDGTIWQLIVGLPLATMIYVTCIAVIIKSSEFKKNRLSVLYLCGFFLYLASAYFTVGTLDSALYFDVVLNFIFVIIHSILLSDRFAKATLEAENARLKEREHTMKNDLMQTVSHEMRTPLTVMSVYAELAVKEMSGGNITDQTLSDLNTISNEALRLADLAGSVLNVFRDKNADNKKAAVDITGMASQLAGLLNPSAKNRNVTIDILLSDKLPSCWGSPDELTRVLWNLFDNAVRHTENGTVTVNGEHKTDSGYIEITVTDTGSGIAQENLHRVFERGFSGATGIKKTTGFGLAFCKEIVEAHGGKINLESEIDKGTSVTFSLPIYTEGIDYE